MDPEFINACSSSYIPSNKDPPKFGLKIANKSLIIRVANKEDLINNNYFCKRCPDAYFDNFKAFQSHMQLHKNDQYQIAKECKHCDATFVSNRALILHCRNFHGHTLGLECNICGKKFTTRQYLNLHLKTHVAGNRFYCRCGQWYRNNQELIEHDAYCSKTANKNLYSCNFCEQTFRFPRDKILHERTHTGLKPFACQDCNKRFSQISALNVHKRIHTKEQIHQCRFCTAKYTDSSAARRHERNFHYVQQ